MGEEEEEGSRTLLLQTCSLISAWAAAVLVFSDLAAACVEAAVDCTFEQTCRAAVTASFVAKHAAL